MITRSRLLALEAAAYLLGAKLALAVLPWPSLEAAFARRPVGSERRDGERERARRQVRQAVRAASRRLPGMVCFPQAVAAQAMLRRRSVATTLVCGASAVPSGFEAHVWLTDGDVIVTGAMGDRSYTALARYPH